MSNLVCNDIYKSFGKNQVLHNIALTLEPHKIYGLLGRNGAGKTTLLGLLSGQSPVSQGSISLDGAALWENQAALDQICFSREINTSQLFGVDNRKVKEFLAVPATLFPFWDKAYAGRLLVEFEIDVKKRMNKLSKGMLSAIAIVIALASKAPFTFLDEPVAGLDVFMRDKFYALLIEEFTQSQRTFVVSTHIIDEAANVLENSIFIEKGKIIYNENTEELLSRHRLVSGKTEDIDAFATNYPVCHSQILGKSKSVCLEIEDEDQFLRKVSAYDFDVHRPGLQKLFTQLL